MIRPFTTALPVTLLQLMCKGDQISSLLARLRAQSSCCSTGSSTGSAERVFAHEDENLSVEPVLLAQCVAHVCATSDGGAVVAGQGSVSALQAAQDLKQLLCDALAMPAASTTHCGGPMRQPSWWVQRATRWS